MHIWMGILLATSGFSASALEVQKPFFYRIKSATGKESYVLGTFHLGVQISDFSQSLVGAVSRSRLVLFENLTPSSKRSHIPLSPEVRSELKELGYSDQELEGLGDENCIRVALGPARSAKNSLDQELFEAAKLNKIETGALETQIPPATDCRLSKVHSGPGGLGEWRDRFNRDLDRLLRQYSTGEPGTDFTSDVDEMRERNKAWMHKLTDELEKGNVLAVVGVAHLYGYSGIIELLRDRGYNVQRENLP